VSAAHIINTLYNIQFNMQLNEKVKNTRDIKHTVFSYYTMQTV